MEGGLLCVCVRASVCVWSRDRVCGRETVCVCVCVCGRETVCVCVRARAWLQIVSKPLLKRASRHHQNKTSNG